MLAHVLVLKLIVIYYVIVRVHRSSDLQRKVCTVLKHYARTPNDKSRKHLTNENCLVVLVSKVSYLLHYVLLLLHSSLVVMLMSRKCLVHWFVMTGMTI